VRHPVEDSVTDVRIRIRFRELKRWRAAGHQLQIILNISDEIYNVTVSLRIENCDIA
jgi:hypothetical protein